MTELVYACEVFATVDQFFACACDCTIDPEDAAQILLLEAALAAASDQLTLMSAHTVRGICEQVITTCVNRCSCRGRCRCGLDVIQLPGPIVAVSGIESTIAGEWDYVFSASDFVIVDDYGIAIAPASTLTWPGGVMLDITYGFGQIIDQIARNAAIELACAAMTKCLADSCTALGPNPGTVSRQGITITRSNVSALATTREMASGQYPWMSKFMAVYNPDGTTQAPFIWSPDLGDVMVLRSL